MKAISICQPWASAIAVGSKRIETRAWSTRYRGPIAIHASKRLDKDELLSTAFCSEWRGALTAAGLKCGSFEPLWELLPFGAIIAVAQLVDCRPTESFTVGEIRRPMYAAGERAFTSCDWTESQLGDFSIGRFGLVLDQVRRLVTPIPCKGRQKLFDVPDDLLANAELVDVKPAERRG